ncbi:MAG: universal stress protein [Burkholderiaceae bacterium]
MTPKRIFCPLGLDHTEDQIGRIVELADRSDAHLTVPLIEALPPTPPVMEVPISEELAAKIQAVHSRASVRAREFEEMLHRKGLSAEVVPVVCEAYEIGHRIGWHGRFADVAIVAAAFHSAPKIGHRIVSGLLFESGKPVLVEPPAHPGVPLDFSPAKVLIAWDGGLASSRAVAHAISLLQSSTEVHIVCIDLDVNDSLSSRSEGWELADYLSRHSLNVTVTELSAGGLAIDAVLNRHATEVGVDLIVMGGFGHSRLRNWVLGSTTRSMLSSCVVPVLMAH